MPTRQEVLNQLSRYLQQLPVGERYLAMAELNQAAQNSVSMNESVEFERRRARWREQNLSLAAKRKAIEAQLNDR